eukprot:Platyproteum_vivax@DN11307_c0_g1_i1.p1
MTRKSQAKAKSAPKSKPKLSKLSKSSQDTEKVKVYFAFEQSNQFTTLLVLPNVPLRKVFERFCERNSLKPESCRCLNDGHRVNLARSINQQDLSFNEETDRIEIDVFTERVGG